VTLPKSAKHPKRGVVRSTIRCRCWCWCCWCSSRFALSPCRPHRASVGLRRCAVSSWDPSNNTSARDDRLLYTSFPAICRMAQIVAPPVYPRHHSATSLSHHRHTQHHRSLGQGCQPTLSKIPRRRLRWRVGHCEPGWLRQSESERDRTLRGWFQPGQKPTWGTERTVCHTLTANGMGRMGAEHRARRACSG
jgi:hypothetical protein